MKLSLLLCTAVLVAFVCCKKGKNSHDDIFTINQKMFKRAKKEGVTGFSANNKDKKVEELYEGDILLTPKLSKFLDDQRDGKETSPFDAAVRSAWPNGRVPYTFAGGFGYRSAVHAAIKEYNAKTCIKFVPKSSSDRSYIEFMHGGGCYSMIGRQGGRQQVSLGNGCGTTGVAIHEMMHALGFFHEQSRRDRDGYIRIEWNNIPGRVRYNFEKYKHGQADTLGESYDKNSIMHYGNYAFSTNGRKTIVSISNPNEVLGQRRGLSTIDVRQLRKMYKCGGVTPVKPQPSSCTDKYTLCPTLARERLCSVSVSSWVKTNCKKSCGGCTITPKCKPHINSRHCGTWSSKGFCKGTYSDFMNKHCSQCKKCRN